MFILLIVYVFLLLSLLLILRRLPSGPYLLANGLGLFVIMPAALLYNSVNINDNGLIQFGNYELSQNYYSLIFIFQALCMFVVLICYKWGFNHTMHNPLRILYLIDSNSRLYSGFTFFCISSTLIILLYIHYSFGFEWLTEPRKLYELSRADFGFHFFVMGTMLRLSALLVLFSDFNRKKFILFGLIMLSLLTGAKINTYSIVLLMVMFYVLFYHRGNLNISLLFKVGLGSLILISLLVWLTFQGNEELLFQLFIGYITEPWNNVALLVQTYDSYFNGLFLGQLFWENNFISHVPRPIFPDKPYLYGVFRLADQYFPEIVSLGIGAPSFGTEGIAYADFGYFGLIALLLIRGLFGWYMGRFLAVLIICRGCDINGNFLYFTLLLFFSDFYIFSLAPANPLLDNLALLILISLLLGIKRVRAQIHLPLNPCSVVV